MVFMYSVLSQCYLWQAQFLPRPGWSISARSPEKFQCCCQGCSCLETIYELSGVSAGSKENNTRLLLFCSLAYNVRRYTEEKADLEAKFRAPSGSISHFIWFCSTPLRQHKGEFKIGKIMLFLTLMAFCTTKEVSGGLGINENQFYLLLFFPGPCT